MTVTLAPGDLGIDMSGFRLDTTGKVKQFHDAGGKFTIRYTAGAATATGHHSHASIAWKIITPAEFKTLIAIGDLFANDEWYESRVTEGAPAGKDDGHAAGYWWHVCGLEPGAAIYPSWDAAPLSGKWASVDAYEKAYKTAISTWGYQLGTYAGTPYLRHAIAAKLIKFGWRPNAGSWSGDGLPYQPAQPKHNLQDALLKTPATIWQTGNYWFNKMADENMLLRVPCGSHWEAYRHNHAVKPPTPKPPTPTPAPKPYYHDDGHGATALVSPDGLWAAFLNNEGKLVVRQYDPKVNHGVARHTI